MDKIPRRLFFKNTLIFTLAVFFQNLISACNGTGASGNDDTDCSSGGHAEVGTNHGHGAPQVTAADIFAGAPKQYTVTDTGATHTHTVTLGSTNFTDLQNGVLVGVATDPDGTGHAHIITFYC
jgi:hypothetical protein